MREVDVDAEVTDGLGALSSAGGGDEDVRFVAICFGMRSGGNDCRSAFLICNGSLGVVSAASEFISVLVSASLVELDGRSMAELDAVLLV